MEKTITSTFTKGIIIALILIILSLASYFMGMSENSSLAWVGYAIYVLGIIISVNIYGKQIDYNSRFGNYFTHGFKIVALVTLIMVIFVVVFMFAFPEIKENALQAARHTMDKGTLSDDQKQKAIELTSKYFMVFAIAGNLLGYIFFGTLAALAGAAITKKQVDPNKDFDELR